MTTPSTPAFMGLVSHGRGLIEAARVEVLEGAYNGISKLFALAQEGKLPASALAYLGEIGDRASEAVENGKPIPDFSIPTTTDGDESDGIPPKFRPLWKAILDGKIKMGDDGMPVPTVDTRQLTDALAQIESALGMTTALSDPKMRLQAILDEIKSIKSAAPVSAKILDEIGKIIDVERNSGESDEDYAKRIKKQTEAWSKTDDVLQEEARKKLGRRKRDDESYEDFITAAIKHGDEKSRSGWWRGGDS